jgi:hypothetical protein
MSFYVDLLVKIETIIGFHKEYINYTFHAIIFLELMICREVEKTQHTVQI